MHTHYRYHDSGPRQSDQTRARATYRKKDPMTQSRVSATVTSTTGTAPITFTQRHDGTVLVTMDDGSSQVYDADALFSAVRAVD